MHLYRLCIFIAILLQTISAHAAEVEVAVASNFMEPMNAIAAAFTKETGHVAKLSFGSSGMLYAQIVNGAPFEVFLSADDETTALIEKMGLGIEKSSFTYAIGTLVLWSAKAGLVDDKGAVLRKGRFNKIAIANPKFAPYGKAALDTLTSMNLVEAVSPKLVQGENISQAYQLVMTGNADLGFVSLSQVMKNGNVSGGSLWIIPNIMHKEIRQKSIILSSAKDSVAAKSLMTFLRGNKAKAIIRSYGYKS